MKKSYLTAVIVFLLSYACQPSGNSSIEQQKPNIIYIMTDDMGYSDLGCYGQQVIQTPNLDQLVKDGIRFTNFYSGSPVCAPARSVLMTGQHTGHTTVRGNFGKNGVVGLGGGEGRVPLEAEDITVAEVLKDAGYVTGMTGKWGLGEPGTTGHPNDQGFDEWFGFLNQRRAHDHYNDYIWKNKEKYEIPENRDGGEEVYTHNLFTDFALDFIERHAGSEKPFFLYIPYLLPHADYEIPEINPLYRDKDWTEQEKIHASMITLIDTDFGKIKSLLQEKGILDNTLIFLTSDNGAARRWEGTFDSSGKLRGQKRDVYEGGIRVPMIVSMPGTVPQGKVNDYPGYFADILPSLAAIGGGKMPENIDGKNLTDVFLKNKTPEEERILYWEFHEQGGKQAVRKGKWKALRLNVHQKGFHDEIELYNLETDPGETNNIAAEHPEIVEELDKIMKEEHTFSNNFPFRFEEGEN
ncbi:MAG: arylsulfatase [Prolixibacteraceae bacterium]